MADAPKTGQQASELDIIEGRSENLGDPVEVHLGDEEPGKGKGKEGEGKRRPADATDGEHKPPVDDGMDTLKRQVAEERRARLAAESRANQEAERAKRFETDRATDQASIIDAKLSEAEREREIAKRAYADAHGSGDAEKVSNAIDKLNEAAFKINKYREAKDEIARRAAQPHEGRVVPREQQEEHDPVEVFARTLPRRTADWIREHPECVTDSALKTRMVSAHHVAISEGHEVNSPEYLASIEARLFGNRQEAGREETRREPARQQQQETRRQPSVAAPARGGSSSSNGNGSRRTVTLTPEQRAVADSMDISYQDYARNLVALENEGRIGKRNMN